jgi:hypothetical protein
MDTKLNLLLDVHIRSKNDIDELYNICIAKKEEKILIKVQSLYDPIKFILSGFFPDSILPELIINYINGMDFDTMAFWHGETVTKDIMKLHNIKDWYFVKIGYYLDRAQKFGDSTGLILYAQDLLYKSMRPITDMSMFRGPNSRTIKRNKILNNDTIVISNEIWNYFPVTRYAAGMSKGMYHTEEQIGKYCGTFYYIEPESTTLLVFKKSRSFFNKTTAMMNLYPNYNIRSFLDDNPNLEDHILGKLPADLMMSPQEYHQIFPRGNAGKKLTTLEVNNLPDNKYYVGSEQLGMYAQEDIFDQDICLAARRDNIDILVLTNMVGSHQVVTEILDSRQREDSFKSLVYII